MIISECFLCLIIKQKYTLTISIWKVKIRDEKLPKVLLKRSVSCLWLSGSGNYKFLINFRAVIPDIVNYTSVESC